LVVGFKRKFKIKLPNYKTKQDDFKNKTASLLSAMNLQGMNYYDPFEVAGYSSYHQFPIFNRNWITTNYLTARYDFINDHISSGMDLQNDQVDIFQYVRDNFSAVAANPRDLIIDLASYFLPYGDNLSFEPSETSELTNQRLNYFLEAFLYSPQIDDDPEAGWTERWTNERDLETVRNQLANLLNAMLQTPEYQLM